MVPVEAPRRRRSGPSTKVLGYFQLPLRGTHAMRAGTARRPARAFVPEGLPIVAQRFIAGNSMDENPSRPGGTIERRRPSGPSINTVQHTLPRGFRKIRHYGWMSPNSKVRLDEVKWLVWLFLGWTYWLASGHAPQPPVSAPPTLRCAECGGAMRVVAITSEPSRLLSEHALAYLDSG